VGWNVQNKTGNDNGNKNMPRR